MRKRMVAQTLREQTRAATEERAARDKARYHPSNPADYGSPIGMPYWDGRRWLNACVGCWYCAPDRPYVPKDAGTWLCPSCPARLVYEVHKGSEHNRWLAYCPLHGPVSVDEARLEDL